MLQYLNKRLLAILLVSLGIRFFISCKGFLFLIFFVDDAFYYSTIASNITQGLGITYDGIQKTNGFHPLFLMLILPFFSLGGSSINFPLHLVAIFSSFVSLCIGILLYKISKTVVDEWYSLFIVAIWSLSPIIVDKELNGMETGLNLLLIVATTYYYITNIANHISDLKVIKIVFLGILLGLVILSRLDGIIFLGIILIHFSQCIIKESREIEWLNKLIKFTIPLVSVVLIFVIPWLVFNYKVSGSIIPTSGHAVRFMSQSYGFAFDNFRLGIEQPASFFHDIFIRYYLENILLSFMKLISHFPYTSYAAMTLSDVLGTSEENILLATVMNRIFILVAMLVLFSIMWKSSPRSNSAWKILFIYSILLIAVYSFYIFGQWFYPRYYFPITFMGTIWGGKFFFSVDARLKRRPILNRLFKIFIIIIFVSFHLLQWRQVISEIPRNHHVKLYGVVQVLEKKTPKEAVIGCFQSGFLEYYSDRKVINLDGVVNQEALKAMKENRLGKYVARKGITYIADWPYVLKTLFFRHLGDCKSIQEITLIHKGFFHIYKINYNNTYTKKDK